MAGLFGGERHDSIDTFWSQVAEEIGEPVLAYGLGRYISGRDEPGPLWGLIYHSATIFYYRHFPQQSWFSSLLSQRKIEGRGDARGREIIYEIPLAQIKTVNASREGSWVQRILSPSPPVISLVGVFESTPPFRFTIENNGDAFLASLRSAVESKDR